MHPSRSFSSRYSPRRAVIALLCVGALAIAAADARALTFKVGTTPAGADSDCQFRTPQEAIDALPAGEGPHVIELESGPYANADAAVEVDNLEVSLVTRFERNSGCRAPATIQAQLVANATSLENGRTVVVRNGGRLTLQSVAVRGNRSGGALVRDAQLTLMASTIEANSTPAGASGAGVVLEGGTLVLQDSRMAANVAGANGGAVFCSVGTKFTSMVVVSGTSSLEDNRANHGGAVYLFHGCTLSVDDEAAFVGNAAILDGGAVGTEPAGDAPASGNQVVLRDTPLFSGNRAGRDGGAIEIDVGNDLESRSESLPRFEDNASSRAGGALHVGGDGARAEFGAARFVGNRAGERGGAIAVVGGSTALHADCAREDTIDDAYCALFERNEVASEPFETRAGGSLYLGGDGELWVDAFAFRDSRGPATLNAGSGGVIGAIDSGLMRIGNSLVFDTREGLADDTHLFQVNGGIAQFLFDTMVDTPDGSVIFLQPAGRAELVGNIIAGNRAGIVGDGEIEGTCNNAQLGFEPAPRDPGFVTTPAGRYRLGPDSPMIDRALGCDPDDLPPGFVLPERDLDGRTRVLPGEPVMALDLGAFEFRADVDRVFGDGFDSLIPN